MPDTATVNQRIAELEKLVISFKAENQKLIAERDQYKKLYLDMMELCKKLEQGIVAGQKREKMPAGEGQLSMAFLGMLLGGATPEPPEVQEVKDTTEAYRSEASARESPARRHRGHSAGSSGQGV